MMFIYNIKYQMSHIYPQYVYRSNSYHRSYPEEPKLNKLQRASQEVRFHQPFERLQKRLKFNQTFQEHCIPEGDVLKNDNFALFDAVIKRGGYSQVCSTNRWEEINFCLDYEKKQWTFSKYYSEVLLPHESKLAELLKWYTKEQILDQDVLEIHLLPSNNLTSSYYLLMPPEQAFAMQNFSSMDEYFNLKTIALLQPNLSKIPVYYADKFMILRKKLLFSHHINNISPKELKLLCVTPNQEHKVIIVGLSLSTLMIADKLSEFGLTVTIIDKNKREGRYHEDSQIVQNGIVMLQGGKQPGSYFSQLTSIGISMDECPGYSVLLDEEGRPIPEQRLRVAEEYFMSLINQMKEEIMNRKKFYEELMSRAIKKRMEQDKGLIKWHHDRYMMMNRMRGENTTVGDLVAYQSKNYVKFISQPHLIVVLRSMNKLYDRVRYRKNVNIISEPIESTLYINGGWSVKLKQQSITGKYLIYADQSSLYRSFITSNPSISDIGSDVMGDSISILQQLTAVKYINCLYTFKDKVAFKETMNGINAFSINTVHGYVYYFVIAGGLEVLAILKCYPHAVINYYSEIYNFLESKCLMKGNRLVGPQNWAFQHNFSLKDQKYMQALIKIKQNQRMYLMLPITTVSFPHRIQSQVDMVNYICTNILEDSYPEYTLYEKQAKKLFLHDSKGSPPKETAVDKMEQEVPAVQQIIHKEKSKENLQIIEQKVENMKQPTLPVDYSKIRVLNSPCRNVEKPQERDRELFDHRFPQDSFGLKNAAIRNYELYLKNKIESSTVSRQGLVDFWKFEVDRQMWIEPHLYLFSLGQPSFTQNQWFKCILEKREDRQLVFPLNKLVTRREHISLDSYYKTTIYYQTILVINKEIYFVIVDEDSPETIYYHNNLKQLITIFNDAFNKLKEEQERDQIRRVDRATIENFPPRCLVPYLIISKIQKQLQQCEQQQPDLNKILESKLQKASESRRPIFMKGFEQEFMVPNKIENINSHLVDMDLNVSIIQKEVDSYIKVLFRTEELRLFPLFQIFFGIINEQYLCCEIMNKLTENPLTYSEIENLDAEMCKQIREVFSRNTINEKYAIFIVPEPGYIAAHRNFMHRTKRNDFEQYTYINNFSKEKRERFLVINHKKIYFQHKDEIMREIIKQLVPFHHNGEIIRCFHELLNKQVEKIDSLTPKLKVYFKMTKKENGRIVSESSMAKFRQKCKEFSQKEKEIVVELMKKKKMKWVEDDFIFVIK